MLINQLLLNSLMTNFSQNQSIHLMNFPKQNKVSTSNQTSKNQFIQPSAKINSETEDKGIKKNAKTSENDSESKLNYFGEAAFIQPTNNLQVQRIANPGEELGQSASGTTRHLISDLTSPISVGSKPTYELNRHGDEVWSSDSKRKFKWSVYDKNASKSVLNFFTAQPKTKIKAAQPGDYRVTSQVYSDGKATSIKLSLDQKVIAEDASLTKSLSKKSSTDKKTYRELINDFKVYIDDAASATGEKGITSRFLASVLHIEITHRGEQRESEIEGVQENINEMIQGESQWPWEVIDRSLGVGQINMSTAAMVTGATKWVDQDKNNRSAGRSQTESNFKGLSLDQKIAIFTLLKWPKSNIMMAAKLLSKLKNRSNRFPELTRKEFGQHEKAASVIASEYNLGPSSSTAADSSASWYGNDVWKRMQNDSLIRKYFKNE